MVNGNIDHHSTLHAPPNTSDISYGKHHHSDRSSELSLRDAIVVSRLPPRVSDHDLSLYHCPVVTHDHNANPQPVVDNDPVLARRSVVAHDHKAFPQPAVDNDPALARRSVIVHDHEAIPRSAVDNDLPSVYSADSHAPGSFFEPRRSLVEGVTAVTASAAIPAPVDLSCLAVSNASHSEPVESPQLSGWRRAPIDQAGLDALHANLRLQAAVHEDARRARVRGALQAAGVAVPSALLPLAAPLPPVSGIDCELQRSLSAFIRLTRITLPAFVELWRHQTAVDYRPNKSLDPALLRDLCADYEHRDLLVKIAAEGVQIQTSHLPQQTVRPKNHGSVSKRLAVLVKNIATEQRAGRVLVLDADILEIWPEIRISPFGVVDKPNTDPLVDGRTIHDLSFPDGASVNLATLPSSIPRPAYKWCGAVAKEVVRVRRAFPDRVVLMSASDITSAFRHVPTHSMSVHLFAGQVEELGISVVDLSAVFGGTLSPASYEVFGGAVSHVHSRHTNEHNPGGFFAYHWVDDHIDVGFDEGTNCADIARSIRFAMLSVLGPSSINEKKFTGWRPQLKALGLLFDTEALTVAMPVDKVSKAMGLVSAAYGARSLSRTQYRSLLGSLRHVATCIRPARAFLQRLRRFESSLHRSTSVTLDDSARDDLQWWWLILHTPGLNGLPLEHFGDLPEPDVTVFVDASDHGLCAVDYTSKRFIMYQFSPEERALIEEFKAGTSNGCDINCRELLSCALAVQRWGDRWQSPQSRLPVHVHFRIDNSSAVSWQSRLSSPNSRVQLLIRLLAFWEAHFNLRISSSHIPGVQNVLADLGSRQNLLSNVARFRSLGRRTKLYHLGTI